MTRSHPFKSITCPAKKLDVQRKTAERKRTSSSRALFLRTSRNETIYFFLTFYPLGYHFFTQSITNAGGNKRVSHRKKQTQTPVGNIFLRAPFHLLVGSVSYRIERCVVCIKLEKVDFSFFKSLKN